MRSLRFASQIFFIILALAACKSASAPKRVFPDISAMKQTPDTALAGLRPRLIVEKVAQKKYYIGFTAGAGGTPDSPDMMALHGIRLVVFRVYTPGGALIDSMFVSEIPTSGTANSQTGQASVMASAGVTWEAKPLLTEGTNAVMTLYTDKGMYQSRATLPVDAPATDRLPKSRSSMHPSVILSIDVEQLDRLVQFIVTVKRVGPVPDGEYLPSGEDVRIELQDGTGDTQWSSADGRAFVSMVGQVQPQEVGKQIQRRILWDGRSTLTHAALPAGVYRIVGTIPAKPKPYVVREDFTWGGVR